MSQTQGKTQPQEERKVTPDSPSKQQVQEQRPGFEVFVKSLPFSATQDEVRKFFEGCGTIENVYLLRGRDGRSKGSGFVRFSNKEGATKAVAKNGGELGGRTLVIEEARPREARDPAEQQESKTSSSIFIGNLSYSTTEADLRKNFEGCGEIKAIRLATDRDGGSKGFAHIDFETEEQAEKAVTKSGSELDGRTLRVDYANASGPRTGGRGRGGFRGRGSFRGSRGGFRGGRGGYSGGYSRDGDYNRERPYNREGNYNGGGYNRDHRGENRENRDSGYNREERGGEEGFSGSRGGSRGGFSRGGNVRGSR